jgi:hypothetical protein
MFYPLIPLIAQFFNIVGEIDYSIGHINRFWMLYASYIGTSIQGALTTLLFFTIDPAWTQLRQDLRRHFFVKSDEVEWGNQSGSSDFVTNFV